MSNFIYIEDIFLKFYNLIENNVINVQYQDLSPINSFYSKVVLGESLTSNQGSFLIKILEKYKKIALMAGLDYRTDLQIATWKVTFRVLDLSKKIYVEKNDQGKLEVCCKFPYQLKNEFDEQIQEYISNNHKVSYWDHEKKIRRLSLYDVNLISLYDFATRHSFDIDETFMCALADVEEIWQNEDSIRPGIIIENLSVKLKNAAQSALDFFPPDKLFPHANTLLMAKSMGFLYAGPCQKPIEKIASSPNNTFWIKTNSEFFDLYKQLVDLSRLEEKIAVILDRTFDTFSWLKQFVKEAEDFGVNREDIRVCFRESKESDTGLNEWIKLSGVGGKIETGKILIFEHKPAKWLFKDNVDVKLIVTNHLYPHTNQVTKDWLESHPCVIYLSDIKPSEQKGKKIVEL